MKTYQEYDKIIRDREHKEEQKIHKGHDHSKMICVNTISASRTSVDYSIEILTMTMKDFLEEIEQVIPDLQFDENGSVLTKERNF